jgi:hypothetical protein
MLLSAAGHGNTIQWKKLKCIVLFTAQFQIWIVKLREYLKIWNIELEVHTNLMMILIQFLSLKEKLFV